MKILIVSESFPPVISGVSVFAFQLSEFLRRSGHRTIIFTAGPDLKRIRTISRKNLKIYYFRSLPNPFRRHFRFSLPQKKFIRRMFESERPDIVHIQDPSPLAWAVSSAAKKLKIPIIITHHFTLSLEKAYLRFFKKSFAKGLKKYLKILYARARVVICPSVFSKKELEKNDLGRKIVVVSNGVDRKVFHPRPKLISKEPVVLYVGRLDPEKEIDVLLEAAKIILRQEKVKFVFVGSGNLLDFFRERAVEEKLQGRVNFVGPLKGRRLAEIYQKAWVFWIASRVESQGIAVLEAFSSGLPVVASNSGGIPETVCDNRNGFLVDIQKPEYYAGKVLRIIKNPDLRNRLSANALKSARRRNRDETFDKIIRIYKCSLAH